MNDIIVCRLETQVKISSSNVDSKFILLRAVSLPFGLNSILIAARPYNPLIGLSQAF